MVRHRQKKKAFKFKRYCEYEPCGKYFETNREWQRFHHEDCRIAAQKEKKSMVRKIIKRLEGLEKRIGALEDSFKNHKQGHRSILQK